MHVFRFADRQSQLKLEAEEICDKDAEESPVDDEEEEETNEEASSLEEKKEKRKEKIRQLLQIKKKMPVEELENDIKETGENQSCVENVVHENENQVKETIEEGTGAKNVDTDLTEQSKPMQIVLSVSDDSNKVTSDVDELNLLQKLHSENEINTSTLESSDTDTQILNISESLTSSESVTNVADIISIENSSYSEAEIDKDVEGLRPPIVEIEMSTKVYDSNAVPDTQEQNYVPQTSNQEYNDSIGNILLASSEDELAEKNDNDSENEETCMNLQYDAISIGETIVQDVAPKNTEYTRSECGDTNKNIVSDGTEPIINEENRTCGDDVVLEKQAKPKGDTIEILLSKMFTTFVKNSEEDNSEGTIPNDHDHGKAGVNKVTELASDSNSPELVNEIQSNSTKNVLPDASEVLEADENIVNRKNNTNNPEIKMKLVKVDNGKETNNAQAESIQNECDVGLDDTSTVDKSNIANNLAASDSVLTKDNSKDVDHGTNEDSLDALLIELNQM